MNTGKIIVAVLSADSTVTAVVGDRISPGVDRQNKIFPRIIYDGGGEEPVETYAGTQTLTNENVTVACVAETYGVADALAKLVKTALIDKDGTFGGINVSDIGYIGKDEGTITLDDDTDFVLYSTELTFKIWFYQPA